VRFTKHVRTFIIEIITVFSTNFLLSLLSSLARKSTEVLSVYVYYLVALNIVIVILILFCFRFLVERWMYILQWCVFICVPCFEVVKIFSFLQIWLFYLVVIQKQITIDTWHFYQMLIIQFLYNYCVVSLSTNSKNICDVDNDGEYNII